jgi:hypothetical protein
MASRNIPRGINAHVIFPRSIFVCMPIRLAQVSPTGSGAAWSLRSTHGVLLSQPDRHFSCDLEPRARNQLVNIRWLILGFEDVIKFELRPPCACPPCAASTTSSMKVNVTKKSDGNVGPTGCVVRAARPTKSPSAVATTANKHADDTLVRTVENGLTTSPGLSSWGGINPCRSGSPTCT